MWRPILASLAVAALVTATAGSAEGSAPSPAADGRIAGELGVVGGAYPGGFHPTSGIVEFAFRSHPLVLVESVGRAGHFTVWLPAGTYTVTGCGASSTQCSPAVTVRLRPGGVDHLQLVWAQVP